ncbi:hypothetical protein BU24DRAFT_421893 [Aaosphaeria arxii CBS 175.79]|uniref:RING-type E3 ubiquitin transferase n=1 Tax=Aaosphaeria arxii CBS 175.79 TaxID=1450172 RepID=A0A6A5XSC7_9PLEO|nr:uncharacterized protein BU24DRAFT_421893 [Aaosphaeria arxii CBS 175.79]KAF2015600.1 hypothetical protein BU24DRAFT_421893 [Aaosphaeria arxii CBS 175.79]
MASEVEPFAARDPEPSLSATVPEKSNEDADTCRICRGDGTAEEPLFYPCKCSGSIKFVHQECLMEWLSHSQKKYCELCKTPFRFTKLYHPGMPSQIPTSVFIRRAAIHVLKMLFTWCRGLLVASVWLLMLPYCMRVVWRSLFWLGDGGWVRDLYTDAQGEPVIVPPAADPRPTHSISLNMDTVKSAIASAKASNTTVSLPLPDLPDIFKPYSQTLNMSAGEPTVWSLVKHFFFGIPHSTSETRALGSNATTSNVTLSPLGSRNPSLLSEVSFFNWFPSQAANRFTIDVLEGQIITLLVVVAFILIFLIREWVVQQQPVINMVAINEDAAVDRAHGHGQQAVEEHVDHVIEDDVDHPDIDDAEEVDNLDGDHTHQTEPDNASHHHNEFDDRDHEGVTDDIDERGSQSVLTTHRSSSRGRDRINATTANDDDDIPERLRRALQADTFDEIAEIINSIPTEGSSRLGEQLQRLSEGHSDDSAIDSRPRRIGNGEASQSLSRQGSDVNTESFPERSSSLPKHIGRDTGPDSLGPPTPRRPDMPARNRSFIAAEIRRSMEEANTWSFANVPQPSDEGRHQGLQDQDVPDSWEDEDGYERLPNHGPSGTPPNQKQPSEHSSDSWQQVPVVVVEPESPADGEAGPSHSNVRSSLSDGSANSLLPAGSDAAIDSHATSEVQQINMPEDDNANELHQSLNEAAVVEDDVQASEPAPDEHLEGHDHNAAADVIPDPAPRVEQPPRRLVDNVLDWLFDGIAPNVQAAEEGGNDEHIVQDLANEAPFVPFAGNIDNEQLEAANLPIQDPEVAAAAAQAGIDVNDQDAIDDAEDLEGIMELIGMQGPLTGLFQNAMFSAVLISATLACAVWFPYLCGKVVLLCMGSPISLFIKFPLQFVATLCDFVVDMAICLGAGAVFWTAQVLGFVGRIFTLGTLPTFLENGIGFVTGPARTVAENAMDRIARLMYESSPFPHPDYFRLSINSHAALRTIQNTTSFALNQTGHVVAAVYENVTAQSPTQTALWALRQAPATIQYYLTYIYSSISAVASWLWTSKSYNITFNLDSGRNMTSVVADLEPWTAGDRSIAIIAGYAFFAMIGALYLKHGSPISTSPQGRKIEQIISDILQQAGGVLKVILIISIEMLVFPLYCGLLLDFALLPLFSNATLYSRWQFAREAPWTSGFVHWFIGTCYMFHFALFVSMCRKIMRKGVLYFIRDPDDPTFHPVRDVLERSVTTQLRKIAFSALVYGGLVVVCLGGVVWVLNRTTTGVLPIQFVSQAPSIEFPLDLLFYNFLTPLIIKVYKPSDGLQTIYQWWFKSCARVLRLSNFLFGEKIRLEEGRLVKRPWHYSFTSWFTRKPSKGQRLVPEETGPDSSETESETPEDFSFEGRYVRAPASDQVRIPKGQRVFVDVNPDNERFDGKQDEDGVHNSDLVTMVYIPPWFRVRIALFVFTIWMFAAFTGVGITVIPLLFGRYLFSLILPSTMEMNDIHALSLGIYTLGTIAYSAYQAYKYVSSFTQPIPSPLSTLITVATTASKFGLRVLRFGYVWLSFLLGFPLMFSILLELYFLMPLHAYLGPNEPHVVHIVQDWTLGFLYARLAARILFANRTSRAARAFRAIVSDGYLNPNARLATRCFVLPIVAIFTVAVAVPSVVATFLLKTVWAGADKDTRAQVFRFSFPLLGLLLASVWMGREGAMMLMRWQMLVRDEVYLIGERLHNFGDRKAAPPAPAANAQQAADTS